MAKKKRSVVSKESTIRKYYERYKSKIDRVLTYKNTEEEKFRAFEAQFRAKQFLDHTNAAQTAKRLIKSTQYTSPEERGVNNLLHKIRGDKAIYGEWRRLTQHKKIDNIHYIGSTDSGESEYVAQSSLGFKIRILITNSPTLIILSRI